MTGSVLSETPAAGIRRRDINPPVVSSSLDWYRGCQAPGHATGPQDRPPARQDWPGLAVTRVRCRAWRSSQFQAKRFRNGPERWGAWEGRVQSILLLDQLG